MSEELDHLEEQANAEPEQSAEQAVEQAGLAEQKEADPQPEKVEDPKVPLAALHEERARRKDLTQQVNVQKDQIQRMETTFQEFMRRQQEAQQKQSAPDPELDPDAYLRHQIEQQNQRLSEQQEWMNRQTAWQRDQMQQQQIVSSYQNQAAEFAQANPDFSEAYQYVSQARHQQLEALGYSNAEANQLMANEELGIVQRSIQSGGNAAEQMYNLAKTMGYTTKPVVDQAKNDQLSKVAAGQAASGSLAGAPGESLKDDLTLADISDLPTGTPEFEQAWAKFQAKMS